MTLHPSKSAFPNVIGRTYPAVGAVTDPTRYIWFTVIPTVAVHTYVGNSTFRQIVETSLAASLRVSRLWELVSRASEKLLVTGGRAGLGSWTDTLHTAEAV